VSRAYLEQLYWLVSGLRALGRRIPREEEIGHGVLACQRHSGGFARARTGIATLEYTHYALEILSALGLL